MPEVNGKHYRSFSAGISANRGGEGSKTQGDGKLEDEGSKGKKAVLVTDKGDGGFSTKTKHEDGRITHEDHDSADEMKAHMDTHFGGGEEDQENGSEAEDMDEYEGGDALSSLKGR